MASKKTSFFSAADSFYFVCSSQELSSADRSKLEWLFEAEFLEQEKISGCFIGPRREMLTPWSTNATDIASNMGIFGVSRIEFFREIPFRSQAIFDPMLEEIYDSLDVNTLTTPRLPEAVKTIGDIPTYNKEGGLALSAEEIEYLNKLRNELGRDLTDAEIFGFAQINSEHCRHKIFNGTFVIAGKEQERSLFELIKETSRISPDQIISAYKDNVAFVRGPQMNQFGITEASSPGSYRQKKIPTVISLKAETHNFPTTVEPFNGASTGSGGEIRDRLAGGRGGVPLAGTAVYMTASARLSPPAIKSRPPLPSLRPWKYQTPEQILIKASNGASDFGNKFGQPLIVGSLFTFEMEVPLQGKKQSLLYAYDRVVMLAGGVGYAHAEHAIKEIAQPGDQVLMLGGDNYRIGMAGGSVSSVDSGAYGQSLELSAIQRSNPEMQKRVFNVIRSLAEREDNPIKLIHDHGAGGHMNCFAELLDPVGGRISISKLPLGDPTLSVKEILCNESQERMGLVVRKEDVTLVSEIASRERAPLYVVGEINGNETLTFEDDDGNTPVSLPLARLFGSTPKTVVNDSSLEIQKQPISCHLLTPEEFLRRLELVLSLEGVACKDWLTNKVDRCVTGRVALQQCVGPLQLPLSNMGVIAMDYHGKHGIALSLGHAPAVGLIDARIGSVLSVAEALTNIVWAPLKDGLKSVALSANWMWPAGRPGEDARLYQAVEAISQFAISLGISIPTGKDSLSMTMRYDHGLEVRSPGTVVVTAVGWCDEIRACVSPDLKPVFGTKLLYLNLSGIEANPLGGSSYAQTLGILGDSVPAIRSPETFHKAFDFLQSLIREEKILSGHDVSSGGLITTLCEMAFGGDCGIEISLQGPSEEVASFLFCEKPGVVLQLGEAEATELVQQANQLGLQTLLLGIIGGKTIALRAGELSFEKPLTELRDIWFTPSFLFDEKQTKHGKAQERFKTLSHRHLRFTFPKDFSGQKEDFGIHFNRNTPTGLQAAVIREQGTNGEREMAFALFAAGFDVKDITMSDLVCGSENLEDVSFIIFPGGFANSDVFGAAKGWAGAFLYNKQAYTALQNFFQRPNTLSLGVCNGCQLMSWLGILYPEHKQKIRLQQNESGKFESSFLAVEIQQTASILFQGLIGTHLGIWVAHGEGRFCLPEGEGAYDIPVKYVSSQYPQNPNGSDFNAAAVVSKDGRHLVMMPHLERSALPWQWPYYLEGRTRREHQVSPWMLAFVGAREWLMKSQVKDRQ